MTSTLVALVGGAMTWTLLEYCIHRWLGHDRRFFKNPFGVEHIAHHSRGSYFAPWWKKVGAGAAATGLFIGPAVGVAGVQPGAAYVAGLVGMYGAYELLHRLAHVHEGFTAYGRWARRHHFFHHFHDPAVNHGVTSPLWDLLFGTYVRVGVVEVPERLKMSWLCDPDTGEVRAHLRGRYRLRALRG